MKYTYFDKKTKEYFEMDRLGVTTQLERDGLKSQQKKSILLLLADGGHYDAKSYTLWRFQ